MEPKFEIRRDFENLHTYQQQRKKEFLVLIQVLYQTNGHLKAVNLLARALFVLLILLCLLILTVEPRVGLPLLSLCLFMLARILFLPKIQAAAKYQLWRKTNRLPPSPTGARFYEDYMVITSDFQQAEYRYEYLYRVFETASCLVFSTSQTPSFLIPKDQVPQMEFARLRVFLADTLGNRYQQRPKIK